MKCAKCGAELKVGCIYCSVCGQEAQIVPDYNLLEDDLLKELLNQEKKQNNTNQQKKEVEEEKNQVPHKKKKKSKAPVIVGAVGAVIVVILLIVLVVNHNHNNSYDYQFEKAETYMQEKEYAKAEKYLERAVELKADSIEALLLLGNVYQAEDEVDDAVGAFQKVIELESDNEKAYQSLIDIYVQLQNYDAIAELSKQTKDSSMLDLFSDYLVTAPEISEEDYEEEEGLEIISQSGTTTYYTLDGSDPKQGKKYEEPIFLEEGTTVIRAISENELGIYSDETKFTYKVEFAPPEAPKVTPDGGRITIPQQITVDVPNGCRAYYTWDGTDPTANSEEYVEPLEIPEGNNIFSVILVDKRERWSDVTKCNFIYTP